MKLNLIPYAYPELIPHGTLQTVDLEMVPYPDHRHRTIRIWTPESYDGVRRYPVLYLHDGQGVFKMPDGRTALEADRVVTELASEGIELIVVAIDTSEHRGTELTPLKHREKAGGMTNGVFIPMESTSDTYADFVIDYLKPLIDENFMTLPDARNTCIGGCSAGGSMSYYMLLRNPEVFGRAMMFSPGMPLFSLESLLKELDEYDYDRLKDHRVAFYNGSEGIDATSVKHVLEIFLKLKEKGMGPTQAMYLLDTRQPHFNAPWQKYLPEMLRFLFAADNTVPQPEMR